MNKFENHLPLEPEKAPTEFVGETWLDFHAASVEKSFQQVEQERLLNDAQDQAVQHETKPERPPTPQEFAGQVGLILLTTRHRRATAVDADSLEKPKAA